MLNILTSAFETICFYIGKSLIYALSLGHFNPDWRDEGADLTEAGGLVAIAGTVALFAISNLT